MASLRDLIDGSSVDTQDKGDVFNHLKDVKRKQAEADIAKVKLHHKLAPVRQLIEMIDQEHPMPGSENNQQQVDEQGNPLPMNNQNQQMKPGMQVNPANPRQQTNQNMRQAAPVKKPAFGNANKTSTKDKLENDKNKKQVGGKKGLEIHVKAESEKIDQMNVKRRKPLRGRYDYHDNPGVSVAQGRGMGLSGGGPGSGRRPSNLKMKDVVPKNSPFNRNTGDFSQRKSDKLDRQARREHIEKMTKKGYSLVSKGQFPNGTYRHTMKDRNGRYKEYQVLNNKVTGLYGNKEQ